MDLKARIIEIIQNCEDEKLLRLIYAIVRRG